MERLPEGIRSAVTEALGASSDFALDEAALPRSLGAYVLTLKLSVPVDLQIPRFAGIRLEPGFYAYAGSARGPGGIKARVGRHLRAEKTVRWHIDHLTMVAETVWAAVFPGDDECALVTKLMRDGAFETPLPGFGSSDCRSCEAHLLKFREPAKARR